MYVCLRTCVYEDMFVCFCVRERARECHFLGESACVFVCSCVYTYVRVSVRMSTCMYCCTCVCMCVGLCSYTLQRG